MTAPRTDPQSTVPVEPLSARFDALEREALDAYAPDVHPLIHGIVQRARTIALDAARASQPITATDLPARVRAFADLGPDWDSYGAQPLRPSTIEKAARIAALVGLPAQAAPGPDGSVNFEWHHADTDLDISIHEDGHASVYLRAGDWEVETPLAALPVREDEPTGIDDPLWFVDKAKTWHDRGFLSADQYGAICAVAFIQMPEDMTPEDRDAAIERAKQVAAEHPEWTSHAR